MANMQIKVPRKALTYPVSGMRKKIVKIPAKVINPAADSRQPAQKGKKMTSTLPSDNLILFSKLLF